MKQAWHEPMPRAEDLALARRLLALAFLSLAYIFYAWAWNTVDVLRPYIAKDLKLTLTEAGSLYSVQALGALFGAVINGQLADRFGRRNALIVIMGGYGLLLALGSVVTSYPQVLTERLILGYFAGSMYPITVSIYVGLFSPLVRGRIAAIVMGASYLAVSLLGLATTEVFRLSLDWHLLLWIGVIPVGMAFLAPLVIPDDRRMIPFGETSVRAVARGRLPIRELFLPSLRRQTILLTMVCGFNFFAYQAFDGWVTTYLKTVRAFGDGSIGLTVAWLYAGSAIGGFFWGWIGDRFGRRAPAIGFFLAAILILVFLFAPIGLFVLNLVAFAYGVCLSSSVVWGPWLSELYPAHLRSTAASIFNWGRIFSFVAPLITGQIAEHLGLTVTMTLGSAVFLASALIWLSLPETLPAKAPFGGAAS